MYFQLNEITYYLVIAPIASLKLSLRLLKFSTNIFRFENTAQRLTSALLLVITTALNRRSYRDSTLCAQIEVWPVSAAIVFGDESVY